MSEPTTFAPFEGLDLAMAVCRALAEDQGAVVTDIDAQGDQVTVYLEVPGEPAWRLMARRRFLLTERIRKETAACAARCLELRATIVRQSDLVRTNALRLRHARDTLTRLERLTAL